MHPGYKVSKMSLFNNRTELIPYTELRLGELDYSIPGCYDNVHTYPMEVKAGKQLFVKIEASKPVDISVVDTKGMNVKFKQGITDETVGPVPCKEKGTMVLIMGVFAGDRSDVKFSAWME